MIQFKALSLLAVILCSNGVWAAKLDHVSRARHNPNPAFNFGAGANTADAQSLFGSIGSYLPPPKDEGCTPQVITEYETVTLPAVTITSRPPSPAPRTVIQTQTKYITQPAKTIISTYVDYSTVVQTVPEYITVTTSRYSTIYSTKIVPTTIYNTITSTQVRRVTDTRTVTETKLRTKTVEVTLPAQTRYITTSITLPPRTVTSTSVTTRVQYSTISTTHYKTSTLVRTSTSVSIRVQPTTIYDTTTVYATRFTTKTVQGPTRTRTSTYTYTQSAISGRVPDPFTITVTSTYTSQVIQPCETQKTGYRYTTPAVPFNFRG